jgi:hypothetical protein
MSAKLALLTIAGIFAVTAAAAQQPPPWAGMNAPAAADQTLGMALMGAYVDSNGALLSGAGATGASRTFDPGQYEVDFNRDVFGCFYSAGGREFSAVAINLQRGGNPNGVQLVMVDSTGAPVNAAFYLIVFCAK